MCRFVRIRPRSLSTTKPVPKATVACSSSKLTTKVTFKVTSRIARCFKTRNIVEYDWNDKYGWGWGWIWINSLPGMCHVKRTSQAKFSIFVTFWDSFMAHVLTWRNLGTLLYYGFSHLKMTLVHCCILNSPLSDWILSRPRPWAQQLPAALQKWPPKVCKNMQKLMQNCKSSSKIHCKSRWYQATCAHSQLPALAAETLSASLTWNVKRFVQHLYSVKWRKFDTFDMTHGNSW